MATPVIMPRQGQSVESCIITEWKKKVGDKVAVGDVLFSYETDKSTFEEQAKVEGTLLAVFYNAEDDVPVLLNVAVIGKPGESFAELAGGKEWLRHATFTEPQSSAPPAQQTPCPPAGPATRPPAACG